MAEIDPQAFKKRKNTKNMDHSNGGISFRTRPLLALGDRSQVFQRLAKSQSREALGQGGTHPSFSAVLRR